MPDDKASSTTGSTWRKRGSVQGCRRGIAGQALAIAPLGLAFKEMGGRRGLKAPIVIGRDHLESGSSRAKPRNRIDATRSDACCL